jgi:hypothetical protein
MEERGERWRRELADGGEWRVPKVSGCRQSVDGERKEKESYGGERIGAKKRLIKKFFLSIIVRRFVGLELMCCLMRLRPTSTCFFDDCVALTARNVHVRDSSSTVCLFYK